MATEQRPAARGNISDRARRGTKNNNKKTFPFLEGHPRRPSPIAKWNDSAARAEKPPARVPAGTRAPRRNERDARAGQERQKHEGSRATWDMASKVSTRVRHGSARAPCSFHWTDEWRRVFIVGLAYWAGGHTLTT